MLGDSASGSHFVSLYAGIVLDLGSVLRWTRLALDNFLEGGIMAANVRIPLLQGHAAEQGTVGLHDLEARRNTKHGKEVVCRRAALQLLCHALCFFLPLNHVNQP